MRATLLVLLAGCAACATAAEDAPPGDGLAEANVLSGGDTLLIDSPVGSYVLGAALPEGWPEGFRLPDGAEILGAYAGSNGLLTLAFAVDAPVAEAATEIAAHLDAAGWSVERPRDEADFVQLDVAGDGYTGTVQVKKAAHDTVVDVTLVTA